MLNLLKVFTNSIGNNIGYIRTQSKKNKNMYSCREATLLETSILKETLLKATLLKNYSSKKVLVETINHTRNINAKKHTLMKTTLLEILDLIELHF